MPEVSVVIPTHDRWELLTSMGLRSALGQEDVDLEVVVVDDGSIDGTAARLRALADPRVVVIRNDVCRGLPHARNVGIAAAKGEWLAFLDDDDAWSPLKLRAQLDTAAATGADFVYSAVVVLDESHVPFRAMPATDPEGLHENLLTRNLITAGGSNVIAKTALVRQLDGFDEDLFHLADWDMWIRLAAAGRPAACDQLLVAYLLHPNNLHMLAWDARPEFERMMAKHSVPPSRRAAAEIVGTQWRAFAYRRSGARIRAAREYLRSAVRHRSAGMLVRAIGVLMGEWAMKLGSQDRPVLPVMPAWLDRYR